MAGSETVALTLLQPAAELPPPAHSSVPAASSILWQASRQRHQGLGEAPKRGARLQPGQQRQSTLRPPACPETEYCEMVATQVLLG